MSRVDYDLQEPSTAAQPLHGQLDQTIPVRRCNIGDVAFHNQDRDGEVFAIGIVQHCEGGPNINRLPEHVIVRFTLDADVEYGGVAIP